MADNFVLVELIENPQVQRQMNDKSLSLNTNKWRRVLSSYEQTVTSPVVEKKKDVEPAVAEKQEFVNPTIEPSGVMAGLREQYVSKYGKRPDGRWTMKKLVEEINKTPET